MSMEIEIRYLRPPDRADTYRQRLVADRPDCKITLLERYPAESPLRIDGRIVAENGSPLLWFVFPGAWHDIGRFHRADGRFTGYYTNVIEPVRIEGRRWEIRDLFLDLWIDPDGRARVLDRDEFDEAVARGWIDRPTADRAERELHRMLERAHADDWPRPPVREIELEDARGMERSGGDAGEASGASG